MKVEIRAILKVLELKNYDPRMAPGEVFVWVNPTRTFLLRRDEAMQHISRESVKDGKSLDMAQERLEIFNAKMFEWYAHLWSKGDDPETHWTADEVEGMSKLDGAFFNWLVRESARLLREHRTGEKKS